jgi:hypothetical protein
VGPRAVLDAVVKRKIPSPRRESKPRTPIVQPVAQRTELSRLLDESAPSGPISIKMTNYMTMQQVLQMKSVAILWPNSCIYGGSNVCFGLLDSCLHEITSLSAFCFLPYP